MDPNDELPWDVPAERDATEQQNHEAAQAAEDEE